MKQLVILSGKGGTGKTSLAAAFAHLAREGPCSLPLVLADADVDAPNLELVLQPRRIEEHEFVGGSTAEITAEACDRCGVCADVCRFEAVLRSNGRFEIDALACEGCGACFHQCPARAIRMQPQVAGRWYRSESPYGPVIHAALLPAQENSGKLVTLVKQQARLVALDGGYAGLLIDGPPGIGCPVISAAAGADLALIVTEPTVAGIHDMERILGTTDHFRVPTRVCVNKADLFPSGSDAIRDACQREGIDIAGSIPFDETVTEAMVRGKPVTAFDPDAPSSRAMVEIWLGLSEGLFERSAGSAPCASKAGMGRVRGEGESGSWTD
jgi:MinD superfamily P-loop ATPase